MTTEQMRYQGCLMGLAAGDALGTTVEFKSPGNFSPLTDIVGGGPFDLYKGQWTDDTSMALCLAESLVKCGTFNARDQMERYTRWWKDGYLSSNGQCFDIGNTVSQALRQYARTGDPFAGATAPHSAGNGSLMRLASVPLFYASDPEKAICMSAESLKTTHGGSHLSGCVPVLRRIDCRRGSGCLEIGIAVQPVRTCGWNLGSGAVMCRN